MLQFCCKVSQPSAEEGNQIHFSLRRSTISRPNRQSLSLFFPVITARSGVSILKGVRVD